MKFEMPKMNVAIFSCENIVTTSGGSTPAVTNTAAAVEALGLDAANVTTATSASNWMNA